ncbi:tRNA nucleotidyltransferase [Streptococcus sp. DD10]|nr:tRNA nucleotidyltransferase [Streptococcus sp. DD10]
MPSEFQEALPVLEKIKAAGFEAYFVGGSVRDALLGRSIHDVDIATSAYPEEIKQIFRRTVDIGIEHGTVLVLENGHEYEVTTFRTEDVYVDYRRPSSVSFVRSLEEDLKRRDFTVNAFALTDGGDVIDLFDGVADLQNQQLRAVGIASERFNEDALRIMRGLRFQASLGFQLEAQTLAAMKDRAFLLEKISVERIFIEFDKLLLAPFWKRGLNSMLDCRVYKHLPELVEENAGLQKLFNLAENFTFTSSVQAWGALFSTLSLKDVQIFLKKWKTSRDFSKKVQQFIDILSFRQVRGVTRRDCYRYDLTLLFEAEELRQAQGLKTDFIIIQKIYDELTIHDKHEIVVNGGMLIKNFGFDAGPQLGQLLKEIEYAIVDGELENTLTAITDFIKEKR